MANKISRERFKWKEVPWMDPQNLQAVWIKCNEGKVSFELELRPNVPVPPSMAKSAPNRIPLTDKKQIGVMLSKMAEFAVSGARGKGIIVGEIEMPVGTTTVKLIVMSTLKDWRDWDENKQFFHLQK